MSNNNELFSDDESSSILPNRPIIDRLTKAAIEIRQDPAEIDIASFHHSILCQVGFPRKKTDEPFFERRSGNALLKIHPGEVWDGKKAVSQPIPYGSIPRLIVIHISTEAVRTKNPCVELGDTIRGYMKLLGVDVNGRGYSMFKKQVTAVAACRIWLGANIGNEAITIDTKPIREFRAWFTDKEDQPSFWPGNITLSQDYFDSLQGHAVPLDTRALKALRHSALSLDIYTWLAYRLCQITKPDGIKISWYALKDQFGQEYKDVKQFKREFKQALQQVLVEYPQAKVQSTNGGLILRHSFPPVRQVQIQVPSNYPDTLPLHRASR